MDREARLGGGAVRFFYLTRAAVTEKDRVALGKGAARVPCKHPRKAPACNPPPGVLPRARGFSS